MARPKVKLKTLNSLSRKHDFKLINLGVNTVIGFVQNISFYEYLFKYDKFRIILKNIRRFALQ